VILVGAVIHARWRADNDWEVKDLGAGMSSDPITGLFTLPTCRLRGCAAVAMATAVHSVAPRLRLFYHIVASRGE
jgi:hypothetical protein